MHTGRFRSQRRQKGPWHGVRLHPADYDRDAATQGGHQGFAANRPAGRGGVQATKSELRKGRQGEITTERKRTADDDTVEHVKASHDAATGEPAVRVKLISAAFVGLMAVLMQTSCAHSSPLWSYYDQCAQKNPFSRHETKNSPKLKLCGVTQNISPAERLHALGLGTT
jgi:hypothetical protein